MDGPEIESFLRDSYQLVVEKLTRKVRTELLRK